MSDVLDRSVADPSRLTPRLRWLLTLVLLADVLDLMDSTITNIAAPTIARDIGGGETLVKWLGAGYALAMGVLLVVGARLGDRFGTRRLFLIGMSGFVLASLLCGVSVDPGMLIACRIVQGAFGALLIPQGFTILLAAFSREQLPRAFAAFGSVLGASAVVGPVVAGLLIDADILNLDWRPIFLINIVLGGVGLVAAWRLLPRTAPSTAVRIDAAGAGLLAVAMFGLIYGLITGSTDGWTVTPVVLLVVGVLGFGGFALRQRQAADPLILPSLLANRGFTSGLLLGLAYFAVVNGLAYVASLFFQGPLGLTPAKASFALSPLMLGIIATSFVARPLVPKLGRRLVTIGLVITLLGALGLWLTVLLAWTSTTAWLTIPAIFVLGVGMGASIASIFDVAVGDVGEGEAGSASGSLSAVQQLAGGIGSAVVTTVFFGQLASHGAYHAMVVSVFVVAVVAALCLALVPLLPVKAAADEH